MTQRTTTRHGLRSNHEELGHFLLTRRARLAPKDVGMPTVGRRRTAGLRREEVSVLAGVGVSWYTWLEQGRDINVSEDVLNAVCRALRLDEPERAYLHRLVGLNPKPRQKRSPVPSHDVLQSVAEGWSPNPAWITDRYWNVAAANTLGRAFLGIQGPDHNCLLDYFLDPDARSRHPRGDETARRIVARFRARTARFPDDPEFEAMVATLYEKSAEFATLWDLHEVLDEHAGTEIFWHPRVGELAFHFTVMEFADCSDLLISFLTPVAGTDTAARLQLVAEAADRAAHEPVPHCA